MYGRQGKALLATNFYNFETLSGILQAAKSKDRPVILQLSESSIHYLGLDVALAMAKAALKSYGVEGWVHLDHGGSIEMAKNGKEVTQECCARAFRSKAYNPIRNKPLFQTTAEDLLLVIRSNPRRKISGLPRVSNVAQRPPFAFCYRAQFEG